MGWKLLKKGWGRVNTLVPEVIILFSKDHFHLLLSGT